MTKVSQPRTVYFNKDLEGEHMIGGKKHVEDLLFVNEWFYDGLFCYCLLLYKLTEGGLGLKTTLNFYTAVL